VFLLIKKTDKGCIGMHGIRLRFLVILCLFSLGFLDSYVFAKLPTREMLIFDKQTIQSLMLENLSGQTNIKAVANKTGVLVETEKIKWSKSCELITQVNEHKLIVKVRRQKDFLGVFSEDCVMHINIQISSNSILDLSQSSGDLTIEGIQNRIKIEQGSGSVRILQCTQSMLNISSGSGDISIKNHGASAKIRSGSGFINVDYKNVPEQGVLDLESGSGDQHIILPANAIFALSTEIGSGSIKNNLKQNPYAPFKINVEIGSGDLNIESKLAQ